MGVMADRAAANEILGRVEDATAHGNHAQDPRTGRVSCGTGRYKNGYAPCQLAAWAKASCIHNHVLLDQGIWQCQRCGEMVRPIGTTGKFETLIDEVADASFLGAAVHKAMEDLLKSVAAGSQPMPTGVIIHPQDLKGG